MAFDRERAEEIGRNAKAAEQDDMVLAERIFILDEAGKELAETYLDGLEEDVAPPEHFDDAVRYAVNLMYKTGSVLSNQDEAVRAIKHNLEFRRLREGDDSWTPDEADEPLITDLIHTGTMLSISDNEPAFEPHFNGRNFEVLDQPGSQYNKYGRLIRPTVSQS